MLPWISGRPFELLRVVTKMRPNKVNGHPSMMAWFLRCGSEDEATDASAVDVEELVLRLLGSVRAVGRLRDQGCGLRRQRMKRGDPVLWFLGRIVRMGTSDRFIPGPVSGGPTGRRTHEDVEELAGQGSLTMIWR